MSGTYLTTATRASPTVAYYGAGGGGGATGPTGPAGPAGPGGATGGNANFSTITMSGPIIMGTPFGSGLEMNNNVINLNSTNTSQIYYNQGNAITYLTGISSPTDSVNIGTQFNQNVFVVNDNGAVVNGSQVITGNLSVSSITNVSTINGAAYPPAVDTYADIIPPAAAFGLGPVNVLAAQQAALSSTFSVTPGHSYRFTTTKVQFDNGDITANQQIGVGGTGQLPVPICQTVSGLLTNSGNNFAATQYVCTWRQQSAGPCEVVAYNNSLTLSTIITCDSLVGMPHILEDLGPLI